MTRDARARAFHNLDALLDQERAALVSGDLEALADLLARKTELIEAIAKSGSAESDLPASLKQKAERNQALLDAAQEGLKQVARRLAMIREMRGRLQTYDADGHTHTIEGEVVHRVEKRA